MPLRIFSSSYSGDIFSYYSEVVYIYLFIIIIIIIIIVYFIFLNFRGQPVASNEKENSEVGVVSNVAIYSLKAKLEKLETETQTFRENVKKLEKERGNLSLLNTEARYVVCL